jgi:hypothetical protein
MKSIWVIKWRSRHDGKQFEWTFDAMIAPLQYQRPQVLPSEYRRVEAQ